MNGALLFLHLTAWTQAAVLLRYYIGAVFGAACAFDSNTWLACVTSPGLSKRGGALFIDLPANALGCFILGLLSPTNVLQDMVHLGQTRIAGNTALLPVKNPIQGHAALLTGLRTGFCGTLTTYSSWLLQMVRMLVGGPPSAWHTEWVAALAGLYVGQAVALQSLQLGQQVAVVIWRLHSGRMGSRSAHGPAGGNGEASKISSKLDVGKAGVVKEGGCQQKQQHGEQRQEDGCASGHCQGMSQALETKNNPSTSGTQECGCFGLGFLRAPFTLQLLLRALDVLALLVTLTLTGVALALLVLDLRTNTYSVGQPRSHVWFSILFAPFGSCCRWLLSHLNGSPCKNASSSWALLPIGTFLANQLAVAIAVMVAILEVRLSDVTMVQDSALFATISGFGGALSTVSTWIQEVQKLNTHQPWYAWGYVYAIITMLTSVGIGIIGYGSAVWTL